MRLCVCVYVCVRIRVFVLTPENNGASITRFNDGSKYIINIY